MLTFVRDLFPTKQRPIFSRILRSVERGQQVYWFVAEDQRSADALRARLSGRNAVGANNIEVDYVSPSAYSAACSRVLDAWNTKDGMELDRPGAVPTLLDRLQVPQDRLKSPYPSARFFLERPSAARLLLPPTLSQQPLAERLSDEPAEEPPLLQRLEGLSSSTARPSDAGLVSRLSDPSHLVTASLPSGSSLAARLSDLIASTSSAPLTPPDDHPMDTEPSESRIRGLSKRVRRRINRQRRDQEREQEGDHPAEE